MTTELVELQELMDKWRSEGRAPSSAVNALVGALASFIAHAERKPGAPALGLAFFEVVESLCATIRAYQERDKRSSRPPLSS